MLRNSPCKSLTLLHTYSVFVGGWVRQGSEASCPLPARDTRTGHGDPLESTLVICREKRHEATDSDALEKPGKECGRATTRELRELAIFNTSIQIWY